MAEVNFQKKCRNKTIGKSFLALLSKRCHPKKYQVSKQFFLKEASFFYLVYINSISCSYKKLSGRP